MKKVKLIQDFIKLFSFFLYLASLKATSAVKMLADFGAPIFIQLG